MNEKSTSSAMIKIVLVFFVIFVMLGIASTRLVYNQLRDEYSSLILEKENLARDVEKLKSYNEAPLDEEYVRRVARENGYCDPDEVIVEK